MEGGAPELPGALAGPEAVAVGLTYRLGRRAVFKVKLAVVALPPSTGPPDLRDDQAASEMTPVPRDDWTVTSKGTTCASATLISPVRPSGGPMEAVRSRALGDQGC